MFRFERMIFRNERELLTFGAALKRMGISEDTPILLVNEKTIKVSDLRQRGLFLLHFLRILRSS